jgi:hypothetical protein
MPFLAGRGQGGRGMFGLGAVPGAPTFANNPGIEGNVSIPVTFIAPAFNGRTSYYWLQVCPISFY